MNLDCNKENIPELRDVSSKDIHKENFSPNILSLYPAPIVNINTSRQRAIKTFLL